MATTAESGSGEILRSERIAGGILPPVLNTFDMVAIFVAIVLFISNSAILAGGAGASAYFYWGLGFITFLIPGAIVTGQLGRMFPGEGSIYVWTTKAFGSFLGFFAGFCAWWPSVNTFVPKSLYCPSPGCYILPNRSRIFTEFASNPSIFVFGTRASRSACCLFSGRLASNKVSLFSYSLRISDLLMSIYIF